MESISDLQTIRPCANCMEPCEGVSLENAEPQVLSSAYKKGVGEANWNPVTISEALDLIFGITFFEDSDNPSETVHKRLVLCGRCDKHLSELYRLFCEFEDLCHEDSFIRTHIEVPCEDYNLGAAEKNETRKLKTDAIDKIKIVRTRSLSQHKVFQTAVYPEPSPGHFGSDYSGEDNQMELFPKIEIKEEQTGEDDALLDFGLTTPITPKRGRGRPRKEKPASDNLDLSTPKRKPGRPKKERPEGFDFSKSTPGQRKEDKPAVAASPKRKRGRPRREEKYDTRINDAATAPLDNSEVLIVKRKRGRPRKYLPNTHILIENGAPIKNDIPEFTNANDDMLESTNNEVSESKIDEMPAVNPNSAGVIKRKCGRPLGSKNGKGRRRIFPNEKSFVCDTCGKIARSKANLKSHIQVVHQGFRPHQCQICKKRFVSKCFLENHTRVIHNGESNIYKCKEPGCSKAFKYPAGLFVHKQTHTDTEELKYECEICRKKFHKSASHKNHMAFHSATKDFMCEECGSAFKTRSCLRKHMVIHDDRGRFQGKPPPKCNICNKTFLRYENHRIHMRTHEGILPHKCPICSKAFSHKSNLKVHLRGFHRCPKDSNNKLILPFATTADLGSTASGYSIFSGTGRDGLDDFIVPDPIPELPELPGPNVPYPVDIDLESDSISSVLEESSQHSQDKIKDRDPLFSA